MILTVTLNPAVDLTLEVDGWVLGEVNRAASVAKVAGGKGINVSRMLRDLGEVTTALTILGTDSVHEFQRLAREARCPIIYINIPGEVRTNIHLMDPSKPASLKVNQPGVPVGESHLRHFMLLFQQQLKGARLVCMGGSLPPGCPPDTYAQLAALCAANNVPFLMDAAGEPLRQTLPHKPLIAKPNRRELEDTLNRRISTPREIYEGARELQNLGARCAVVTDGDRPVLGVLDDEAWLAVPPKISPKGATGAGDSLAAGLVSGLQRGYTFPEALRLGVACGTACCLEDEHNLAAMANIDRLLGKVHLKPWKG